MTNLLAAVGGTPLGTIEGLGPLGDASSPFITFERIVSLTIGLMTVCAGLWFIVQIFIASFNWLASGGEKQQLDNAKKRFTNAITGLFLVVISYSLIAVVSAVLGLPILDLATTIVTKLAPPNNNMTLSKLLADADCGGIGNPCPPPDTGGLGIKNPVLPPSIGNIDLPTEGIKILQTYLSNFIVLGLGLAGIVTLFMVLWGSYDYIVSGGDKEATQKAAKKITSGLIGLTLSLSIFAIIFVVETLFGVSLLKITIPTIQP